MPAPRAPRGCGGVRLQLLLPDDVEHGMPTAAATTVARLVELADRVSETDDRTTLLRAVNG